MKTIQLWKGMTTKQDFERKKLTRISQTYTEIKEKREEEENIVAEKFEREGERQDED